MLHIKITIYITQIGSADKQEKMGLPPFKFKLWAIGLPHSIAPEFILVMSIDRQRGDRYTLLCHWFSQCSNPTTCQIGNRRCVHLHIHLKVHVHVVVYM